MSAQLQALQSDALDMLVLWATTQAYSADIEAAVKTWAATFDIAEDDLQERLEAAAMGSLLRPDDSRVGLLHAQAYASYSSTPTAGMAAPAAFAPAAAAGSKRGYSGPDQDRGAANKRFKTVPAVLDPATHPYANIGPALGRKVLRYWPQDAGRNKGNPWFTAVVTDFEEDTGAHILTYQFGTQREEKERVSLAAKQPHELQLTDETVDLLEWFADPKKRRKSSAVEKSAFLRKQWHAAHGPGLPPGMPAGRASKSGKSKAAGSGSAFSMGFSF